MTPSLTEPLTPVTQIPTEWNVFKILRVGDDLLLGQTTGYLQVFDMKNSNITSAHNFKEGSHIHDIVAIDDTHYLLAASRGLLKTTKD